VHQVLATLGYGDAIGHEVRGIQRALRRAGYESDIFVETADRRLEPLTRDYRELVDASRPENLLLHHFSIGSKASRTAYALPDRMALIYHNITPPEYFVGVHRTLARQCFRGRRELSAYVDRCDLALGDSEFNRQDLEQLGFSRTGVLPVVPDLAHLDVPANPFVAGQFDDEWTNILFVGRVIANKKIEDVIRFYHQYHTQFNPRSRLIIVGVFSLFERYMASLNYLVAELGLHHVHFTGPVCERARGFLRATRGSLLQTGPCACLCRDSGAIDDGRRGCAVREPGSGACGRAHGRHSLGRGSSGRPR
jgi:glycosyltransferase involved in cell wall biosynthesis